MTLATDQPQHSYYGQNISAKTRPYMAMLILDQKTIPFPAKHICLIIKITDWKNGFCFFSRFIVFTPQQFGIVLTVMKYAAELWKKERFHFFWNMHMKLVLLKGSIHCFICSAHLLPGDKGNIKVWTEIELHLGFPHRSVFLPFKNQGKHVVLIFWA